MVCDTNYYYFILRLVPENSIYFKEGNIQGLSCLQTLDREPPIDIYSFRAGASVSSSLENWLNQNVDLHYLEIYSTREGNKIQKNISAKIVLNENTNIYTLTIDHKI